MYEFEISYIITKFKMRKKEKKRKERDLDKMSSANKISSFLLKLR